MLDELGEKLPETLAGLDAKKEEAEGKSSKEQPATPKAPAAPKAKKPAAPRKKVVKKVDAKK
jgi:hypothetical protein